MGITGMIGPTLFSATFAYFITARAVISLPGAPFLLAALMTLAAMLLAVRVTRVRTLVVLDVPATP